MRILITLPPEQVANILNGDQTIIIRKTAPKCELPIPLVNPPKSWRYIG